MTNRKTFIALLSIVGVLGVTSVSYERMVELKHSADTAIILHKESEGQFWQGQGFSDIEKEILHFFQARGITDRRALSVILGNIRHESQMNPRICEGGRVTGYKHCWRGGFGLIQWTTVGRFDGLGHFARNYRVDPNDLKTQLRYIYQEREWKEIQHIFETPGLSHERYMTAAYRWLGWGIYGARGTYSVGYYNRLYK